MGGESEDEKQSASNISVMPVATVSVRFGDVQMALDALRSENVGLVFMAVQAVCHALRKQEIPRMLEPLVALLDSGSHSLRWGAALALGELGDQRAVKPLIARLDDENFCVRIAAADSLGMLGNSYAVGPLTASLDPRKEKHAHVRAAVASALGAIKDKSALPHLLKTLKDEEASLVISAISGALGEFDDAATVRPLIKALDTSGININAALSLGKLSNRVTEKQVLKLLYLLKNGHSYQLRAGCALAIGEIGHDRTLYYLKGAAEEDSSAAVRWAVAKAMHKAADKAYALKVLLGLLKNKEKKVSRTAVGSVIELLKDINSSAVKKPLSSAAMELDHSERELAAILAAENYLKLAHYLGSVEAEGRSSFFDAEIAEMERVAGINEILKRIESLEKKGGKAAVESLMGLLKDKNGHVRKAASESLERLLRKSDSVDVEAALADESAGDRIARIRFAAKRMLEAGKTMAFDGRMLSRRASKTAITVPDTIQGKLKTPQ